MHVPDGFLDAPTSLATAAIAAAGVGLALRGARRELSDATAPLAGLVPVGAGTSGHLLGGALAAVLVGPFTATLCLTVVLLIQGLAFADGGLTALGTNITLMGLVGVWVGYAVFRAARAVLPRRTSSVPLAAAIGAFVSVPAAALAFSVLFAIGGQAPIEFSTLAATMIGWHTLIGLGEATITFLAVASIAATRPDLVYGARDLVASTHDLEVRTGALA